MIRIFRVSHPTSVVVLLISEFILLASAYIVAGYFVFDFDPTIFLLYDGGLARILAAVVSVLLGLHFVDLYSDIRMRSRVALVLEMGQAIGLAFIFQALISYVDHSWMLPRKLMIWGSASGVACLLLWRAGYSFLSTHGVGEQRVLFLGRNSVVHQITEYLDQHPELGMRNVGYVVDSLESQDAGGAPAWNISQLREAVQKTQPDRIVVGLTERRARLPLEELLECRFSGIMVEEAPATYETVCQRVCTKELRPGQLIFSGDMGPRRSSVLVQSIYSPVLAAIGTLISLPLMLITAIAVRVSSPGPVLYRQRRVGLNGKGFTLYKFRSMYANAEAATGAVWAAKDDPRVTPVGRVIRALRLDELPQFLNVLRGDMAIVGPRPERPEFVRLLSGQIPYYRQRLYVKPGITGWAQINYPYSDSIEDSIIKLEYDLYYIKNISLSLDGYILFHTVKTMLLSRGAQ